MNEPILTADALVKHYPVKETPFAPSGMLRAVDGVDLTLREGGDTGACRGIGVRQIDRGQASHGAHPSTSGTIHFRGRDMGKFGKNDWGQFRREVQMIFQGPLYALPQSAHADR